MEDQFSGTDTILGLTGFADVYDREDLYELLDNARIVELSRLGGAHGFSGPDNVLRSTGISVRRMLRSGVSTADLGVALCIQLEQQTGMQLREFPAVMLCHSGTNPLACEELAAELSERLALPDNHITAFNFGCSGFLKLLHEAVVMMSNEPDLGRVALLNIETPEFWHDASDRLFCGIVGAGATAMVVARGEGVPISVVQSDDFAVSDDLRPNPDPLFRREIADAYCFRGLPIHRSVMRMNAEPVFLNGIELMLNSLRSAACSIDVRPGQRVVIIPHQPSGKLLKALIAAARGEFPHFEYLNNLRSYGNTISSSVPTILARLPEVLADNGYAPLQDGDHVILLAAGICMEEISNHMSAGYACLQWASATSPLHMLKPALEQL